MARRSLLWRRLGRVALCAAFAAGGAAVAHFTDFARPSPASAAVPAARAPIAGPEPARPPERIVEPRAAGKQWPAPSPAPREATGVQAAVRMPDALEVEGDGFGERFAKAKVITGASEHRLLLFTFDDGPDMRYTPDLLDTLEEHDIKALFFLTAERIGSSKPWGRQHAAIAREIVERGHIIGNHTVDHSQLPLLDDAAVTEQLDESEAIFERVLGERPWLFRPPGGARSARVDALVEARGYTQVMWNLGAGDFQVRTAEDVVQTWKNVFERRREEDGHEGGIILLHDIHEWSVEAVPLMVEEIRRWNCRALARGEELYDIVDDPRLFVVPRGDAEPGAEAPPADPPEALLERRQARLRAEAEQRCEG